MDPVLIFGGCGNLGHHIVQQLLESKEVRNVTVVDVRTDSNLVDGAKYIKGSVTSEEDVRTALQQVRPRVIIDTISPQPMDNQNANTIYEEVNINGTRNLLDRIKEFEPGVIKAFIYTSSSSVVHNSSSDIVEGKEDMPLVFWPEQTEMYSHTKAVAETMVMKMNGENGVLVTALRGTTMFGEGDRMATPRFVETARAGRAKFQVGDGKNLFDFTYVGNTAYAHILAAKALVKEADDPNAAAGPKKVNGEIFTITNDDHWPFWDFTRAIAAAAGHPVKKSEVWVVPSWLYYSSAMMAEWAIGLASFGTKEASINRRMVKYLTMNRTFNIDKAKERLGYRPKWTMDEGIKRAVDWYLAQKPEKKKA